MSDSTILGNKGPLHHLTDGDKDYPISFLTQAKKVEFEMWVEENARQGVFKLRPHMSPAEWDQRLDKFEKDVAKGVYKFGSRAVMEALQTEAGGLELARILFGLSYDDFWDLHSRKSTEMASLMRIVYEKSKREFVGNGVAAE